MVIDAIKNGIVIDHIKAGKSMEMYRILGLDKLQCSVAITKNVSSAKMGKEDIIKIDETIDIDLDALGYVDPNITVNIIRDGVRVQKFHVQLPKTVTNVIRCTNPRCITSTEQELDHVFKLVDEEKRIYRCIYCESRAKDTHE